MRDCCDCGPLAEPVTDWAHGDVVCRRCGVVTESHVMDDAPDWADWTEAPRDRGHGGGHGHGGGGKRRRLRGAEGADAAETSVARAREMIHAMVREFGMTTTSCVATVAKGLFADLEAARHVRGDVRRAAAAAAVYYAFKLEGVGREARLVADVCGVDLKALNAATAEYKDVLRGKPYHARLLDTLHAGQLLAAALDRLRLDPPDRKRVWRHTQLVHDRVPLDCGRKPRTLCAGILFLAVRAAAAELARVPSKKDVMDACAVCQQTLDKVVVYLTDGGGGA